MPEQANFIVLEGLLSENGEFELLAGYETSTASTEHRQNTNSVGLEVALIDSEGNTISSITPDVRFPTGCTEQPTHMGQGLVQAAIACHEKAEKVVVRMADREIFQREIGQNPPQVEDFKAKPTSKKRLEVKTTWGDQIPDHIQLFLKTKDGTILPIPPAQDYKKVILDLTHYAGFGSAHLVLVASKGFRSTTAESETFDLPEAKTTGKILRPLNGAVCEQGERLSLIANLSDQNGRKIEWSEEHIFWGIDGKQIDDTRQIAMCPELNPGKHGISLFRVKKNGKLESLDEVEIEVSEPTAGMKAYAAALGRLREHQAAERECNSQDENVGTPYTL